MPLLPKLQPWIDAMNDDPTDWQRLGVLADWLEDQDDPEGVPPAWTVLAPGFRALSHHRRQPWWFTNSGCWNWSVNHRTFFSEAARRCLLPGFWFQRIETNRHVLEGGGDKYTQPNNRKDNNGCLILKAAAKAFTKIPPEWRLKVMAAPPGELEGL